MSLVFKEIQWKSLNVFILFLWTVIRCAVFVLFELVLKTTTEGRVSSQWTQQVSKLVLGFNKIKFLCSNIFPLSTYFIAVKVLCKYTILNRIHFYVGSYLRDTIGCFCNTTQNFCKVKIERYLHIYTSPFDVEKAVFQHQRSRHVKCSYCFNPYELDKATYALLLRTVPSKLSRP